MQSRARETQRLLAAPPPPPPPPPPPRTNRTRRVPHPVLIGHAPAPPRPRAPAPLWLWDRRSAARAARRRPAAGRPLARDACRGAGVLPGAADGAGPPHNPPSECTLWQAPARRGRRGARRLLDPPVARATVEELCQRLSKVPEPRAPADAARAPGARAPARASSSGPTRNPQGPEKGRAAPPSSAAAPAGAPKASSPRKSVAAADGLHPAPADSIRVSVVVGAPSLTRY